MKVRDVLKGEENKDIPLVGSMMLRLNRANKELRVLRKVRRTPSAPQYQELYIRDVDVIDTSRGPKVRVYTDVIGWFDLSGDDDERVRLKKHKYQGDDEYWLLTDENGDGLDVP